MMARATRTTLPTARRCLPWPMAPSSSARDGNAGERALHPATGHICRRLRREPDHGAAGFWRVRVLRQLAARQRACAARATGHRPEKSSGLLGNSGNSAAPHLHFQLSDGPNTMTSASLPFVIDEWTLAGNLSDDPSIATTAVTEPPIPQIRTFPLQNAVANFP